MWKMPLGKGQIQRLRDLRSKASVGPWHTNGPAVVDLNDDHIASAIAVDMPQHQLRSVLTIEEADAELIATAINALPALLDEVERSRKFEVALNKIALSPSMSRSQIEDIIDEVCWPNVQKPLRAKEGM